MGNSCQQMMKQNMDADDISVAPGRNECISSDYMKKRSTNSFSSLKKRLLTVPSFLILGCIPVKGPDVVPSLCNLELSRKDQNQLAETAALSSTNSPCKRENSELSNLNYEVQDVNKEAEDFIARMKERLKLERKVSEMEYADRIQRGEL